MSKKILVVSDYWIGDTIKTQTVCQVLKEEDPQNYITFLTKWPQLYSLLQHNPYIDEVILNSNISNYVDEYINYYDEVRRNSNGPSWTPIQTPGELYQRNCGIENPINSFKVYTNEEYDKLAKHQLSQVRQTSNGKLLVGVDLSWRGAGGTSIDIMEILQPLLDKYVLVPVGLKSTSGTPSQIVSASHPEQSCKEFTYTASIIKYLDVILTSESGISNLAIGIGTTPIIYTKDFLYHLAGPNGYFGKNDHPETIMGPEAYKGVTYVDSIHQDYGIDDYVRQIGKALQNIQSVNKIRNKVYNELSYIPSDINEHMTTLYEYACECKHITEMGVRGIMSTWAFLAARPRKMVSYDLENPSKWGGNIDEVYKEIYGNIDFTFIQANVLEIEIKETDLLFIDTWHVYDQLKQELFLHSSKARKYIIFHDTTSYENKGESEGYGGIWKAIEEFLDSSKEWKLHKRYTNNNGLTILKRI